MTMRQAIDTYITAMRYDGRINSARTETAYRQVLHNHADDVANRAPHTTNRDDCIRTLQRWPNTTTRDKRLSILISFYRWTMREGIRPTNPAEQVPRPRTRTAQKYKLTRSEVGEILKAAQGAKERRAMYLGCCAGLRSHELRNLQGRHLARHGYIWVSPDIGKGGRERWIPIIAELELVAAEIKAHVGMDEHVLPRRKLVSGGGWGSDKTWVDDPSKPMSSQTLQRMVARISKRACIGTHIHPHLMRHAFLSHIARATGDVGIAQALAGHADISTTQTYLDQRTLDELTAAVRDVRFTDAADTGSIGTHRHPTELGYASVIQPQTPMGTGIAPDLHNGISDKQNPHDALCNLGYAAMRDTASTTTPAQHHTPAPGHTDQTEREGFEPSTPTHPQGTGHDRA